MNQLIFHHGATKYQLDRLPGIQTQFDWPIERHDVQDPVDQSFYIVQCLSNKPIWWCR